VVVVQIKETVEMLVLAAREHLVKAMQGEIPAVAAAGRFLVAVAVGLEQPAQTERVRGAEGLVIAHFIQETGVMENQIILQAL
jgi:hypothetical protein